MRTDSEVDKTKLTVVFRNFANAPLKKRFFYVENHMKHVNWSEQAKRL